MANNYPVGTAVKCRMLFYSDAAKTTAADPSTITFRQEAPTGVITEYIYGTDSQLVKSTTGDYYVLVTPDAAGTWTYTFKGTGTVAIVEESTFTASRTIFQN